ncbi:hypothetical protein [Secundilactobacillus kimchicus]|uniref:hypothetical protein n=1 Tax=Secundilactobacillus kimchicus TaxID=528209 RepID=UPI0024A9B549|nr:hypothetical protein [Secundilactobacillus kimchicus]
MQLPESRRFKDEKNSFCSAQSHERLVTDIDYLHFLAAAGFCFLNYAFSMTGLGLDLFTAFTNSAMATAFGAFISGVLVVISLWSSWNRFYAPVWLVAVFGICYVLFSWKVFLFMEHLKVQYLLLSFVF